MTRKKREGARKGEEGNEGAGTSGNEEGIQKGGRQDTGRRRKAAGGNVGRKPESLWPLFAHWVQK